MAGVFDSRAVAIDIDSSDKCLSDSSSSLSPNLRNEKKTKFYERKLININLQSECLTKPIIIKHIPIKIDKQKIDVKFIKDF